MDNAYARRWIGVGDRPDAPFRILAPLVGRDVKNLDQVIAIASQMAAVFKYAETKFLADRGSTSSEHIETLHSQPFELVFVDDEVALVETLGDLLYEDVDFILPGDRTDEATRWANTAVRKVAGVKKFTWPPSGWERLGDDPNRPFRILAPLHMISFGDFFGQVYAVAKLAAKFRYSETTFLMHDVHPYQKEMFKYFPYPCKIVVAETNRGFKNAAVSFYRAGQDFVAPQEYSSDKFTENLGRGHLVMPPDRRSQADEFLRQAGLDPENWYCCLHFRQPNYVYKSVSNCRDVEPEPYLQSIDYVIDELGGQVVLLGHPELVTRKPRPGFVDLSRFPDNFKAQMYAVARSRFMYCSNAGASSMAYALGVPLGLLDGADFWAGGPAAYLSHTLVCPDGAQLRQRALFESGRMNTKRTDELLASGAGFSLIKCDAADIRRMIDYMFSATSNVEVWRDWRDPEGEACGRFDWPISMGLDNNFI